MANDEILFEGMWYASNNKAKSRSKKLVYDSKDGILTINNKANTFSYLSDSVRIENVKITSISFNRQSLNYWTYIQFAIPSILVILAKQDKTIVIPIFLLSLIFGISIWYSMKWIIIEYETKEGDRKIAWFYDGKYRGWGGVTGTMQKFREIKRFLGVNNKI